MKAIDEINQMIEETLTEFDDEQPTKPFHEDHGEWIILGNDDLIEDEETELVLEALSTVNTKEPWYTRLERELER